MTTTEQEKYVFANLIEASSQRDIGKPIGFERETAEPVTHKNAAGSLRQMSFEDIGARASRFGKRFKSISDAQA